MNVGVYVTGLENIGESQFSFQNSLIEELNNVKSSYKLFVFSHSKPEEIDLFNEKFPNITFSKIEYLSFTKNHFYRLRKLVSQITISLLGENKLTYPLKKYEKYPSGFDVQLKKINVRIIWFLNGHSIKTQIPTIHTMWDLNHRILTSFPEFSYTRYGYDESEKAFKDIPKASYIITGTSEGKKQLIDFYGVYEKKIKVIPIPTPSFVYKKYSEESIQPEAKKIKKDSYVFYPARFWPHKNHATLLNAIKLLKEKHNITLQVVFTGKDEGNLKYLLNLADQYGIRSQVISLGKVNQETIIHLYKNALALTFPSFAGTDNLPPLEAMALSCPVITADVYGAREQLGDAALFFNPLESSDLTEKIITLYNDSELKTSLINKGLKRSAQFDGNHYIKEFLSIINEFEKKAINWERNDVVIT